MSASLWKVRKAPVDLAVLNVPPMPLIVADAKVKTLREEGTLDHFLRLRVHIDTIELEKSQNLPASLARLPESMFPTAFIAVLSTK